MTGFVSGLRVMCWHANKYENTNIVDICVLVSMIDFMPGKGEHETGVFATFTGKAVRRRGVTFMLT